ncbi:MAG: MBL fold metallo-hydrolase [Candidatus Rokubacteria bacterium]|nr:MBL fold metallo-hydrolase [Candidatus Rokubacteria bacterium]
MHTFTIGGATVTRVEETYEPNFKATMFFADWTPEAIAGHRGWLDGPHWDPDKEMLKLSVHSWLVKVGGRTVLIDACVGNDKPRPNRPLWHQMKTPYLDRLAQAGATPAQVDVVMCTHLHNDHVGWNTRLDNGRWVPTFPNARYIFNKTDFDHFRTIDPEKQPGNAAAFKDSVAPVVDAGKAELVGAQHTLDEHLALEPAPGHTPGTGFITLKSRGAEAVFCGDILHHAIQVHHPEWNSFACEDAVNARASRRKVLERCAGSGALLMPAHFGAPFVCRIDAKGGAFVPRFVQ